MGLSSFCWGYNTGMSALNIHSTAEDIPYLLQMRKADLLPGAYYNSLPLQKYTHWNPGSFWMTKP